VKITQLTLRRLSICECGFAVLDDSIQLGTVYNADADSVRHLYRYRCGGCGKTQDNVRVIKCSQKLNPDMPMAPLPLALFEVAS
jgi:hypothetical protein